MTAATPAINPYAAATIPAVSVGSSVSTHAGLSVVSADGRAIPAGTLERLERLDDTVFAALAGDAAALDGLADEWRSARDRVDARLLDEARRHYVSRAESRWRRSQRQPAARLTVGFAALEVLRLFGGSHAA